MTRITMPLIAVIVAGVATTSCGATASESTQPQAGGSIAAAPASGGAGAKDTTASTARASSLQFEATAQLNSSGAAAVQTTLQVRNTDVAKARLEWDDCLATRPDHVRAYRVDSAGMTSGLAWDSFAAYAKSGCDLVGHFTVLDAGGLYAWSRTIPVRDILGDSLPAGRYAVTVEPNGLGPSPRPAIAVGTFDLAP